MQLDTGKLTRYAEISDAMKVLEEEKETLQKELLEEFALAKVDTYKQPGIGTFSVNRRQVWEYSPKVKVLEETVKKAKKEEQESGKATAKTSEFIRFNS